MNPLVLERSKEGVRKVVKPLMLEYFENGDYEEVLQTRLQNLEGEVQASKDHPLCTSVCVSYDKFTSPHYE